MSEVTEEMTGADETPPGADNGKPSRSYGDPAEPGYLLTERDPEKIAKHLQELWEAQTPDYAYRIVAAEVNERRRAGECNVWVKVQDRARYVAFTPLGATTIQNKFGRKADRLCLKAVSHLYQDPAQPEATPSTGEEEDRDSAQLATRILSDLGSEANLDSVKSHKQAWDKASNWGRAYIWRFTDPKGGGRVPMEVMAQPEQQHVEEALAMPGDVMRYVREDGMLSESPEGAALRWLPKMIGQVATPGNVRLWPATSTDLWDADGLIYREYYPWNTLTSWFEKLQEAKPEERDHATSCRPADTKHLLPKRFGKAHDPGKPKPGHEGEGLALLTIKWCVESAGYPDGAYVVTVGDKLCPLQEEWILQGEDGKRERRDLPWTEVMQWQHVGLMDFLGPNNEFREQLYGRFEEWMERTLNRKTLLPFGSTVQPKDMQNPFATTLYFQPGYEPRWEEVPPIPGELPALIERNEQEMQDAAALPGESGQGLQTPSGSNPSGSTSGRQALAVLSQQQANLSDLVQNANRARVRDWRIQLQEMKANFDVPQLLKYQGDDGGYIVKRWRGSDLGNTRDVQVRSGTGTVHNQFQKVQLAMELWPALGRDPEELQEIIASGVSPLVKIADNPPLMRIRRQLAAWKEGPQQQEQEMAPMGQMGPMMGGQPMDPMAQMGGMGQMGGMDGMGGPMMGPPPIDPMTGQPMIQPHPEAVKIFEPVLADGAMINAKIRVRELNLAMCAANYLSFPPEWRMPLEMEYQKMAQAVSPPGPPVPQNAADGGKSPGSGGPDMEHSGGSGPGMPGGMPKPMRSEAGALQSSPV